MSGVATTSAFDMSGQESSENGSASSRPGTSASNEPDNTAQSPGALGATASASGQFPIYSSEARVRGGCPLPSLSLHCSLPRHSSATFPASPANTLVSTLHFSPCDYVWPNSAFDSECTKRRKCSHSWWRCHTWISCDMTPWWWTGVLTRKCGLFPMKVFSPGEVGVPF